MVEDEEEINPWARYLITTPRTEARAAAIAEHEEREAMGERMQQRALSGGA